MDGDAIVQSYRVVCLTVEGGGFQAVLPVCLGFLDDGEKGWVEHVDRVSHQHLWVSVTSFLTHVLQVVTFGVYPLGNMDYTCTWFWNLE